MAGEVALDILREKLKTLLNQKEILSEKSRRNFSSFLEELEKSRTIFTAGDKNARTDQPVDESFTKKLSFIYDVDDMIDKFIPELSPRRKVNFPQFSLNWEAKQILSRYLDPSPENADSGNNGQNVDSENNSQNADSGNNGQNVDSENNSHPSEVTDPWETIAAIAEDSANIIGLEDQREDLKNLVLKNPRTSPVIAVVGEAGSGKTTLVKFVFDSVEIKKEFECCAWITVSNKFEERDLLIKIFRQISVVKEEQKLELKELQTRVSNYLKPRSFLVVLDDIQSADVWEKLKDAFPTTVHTSKVILTMRSIQVARRLGPRSRLFEIRRLDPEETWNLFQKKALQARYRTSNSWEEKLQQSREDFEKDIVSKCDGLPLAIVTLAGLLSAKPVEKWSSWVEENLVTKLSKQGDILFLSYQELPPSLKPFLLYFGIFPKSHKIPIRRLYRLWLAEGLETRKAVTEELLEKNFKQLVQRNLIVVEKRRLGSPKTCFAQPALHDSLFRVAATTGFFHVQFDDQRKLESNSVRRLVQQLFVTDSSTINHEVDKQYQHMRSYVSFNIHKGDTPANEVDELLKRITNARRFVLLTVLDLESVYKPVLSETLGKLVRLKYLGLRWTFLDSIPESIGKLKCLQTLDVKHTNIPSLPHSIWKAKDLCHLYMNEIHFHVPKNLGNIYLPSSKLQTLWGIRVGEDCSDMLTWLKTLFHLRKLGLTCLGSSVEDIIYWISRLENLQSLRLRSVNKYDEPANLYLGTLKNRATLQELHLFGILEDRFEGLALLENLRVLTLSVSQRDDDPMPVLGRLAHLNILRLFARSYIGTKMSCIHNGFPKLRVLKLWVLEELKEWVVEERSMVELGELEIRCCEKLEWPAGLQHLSKSLKELNLRDMPEKFVQDARANMGENVLLVINPTKLDIPPMPVRR